MSAQIRTKVLPVFFWVLSLAKEFCQSGIDLAFKTAWERWHVACYTSPVYNCESCNMLASASWEMRTTSEPERELLLGFDKFYTDGPLKVNPESEAVMILQVSVLGTYFLQPGVCLVVEKVDLVSALGVCFL